MRPKSIIMFERVYLGLLAFGVVYGLINYSNTAATLAANPATRQFGPGFLIAMQIIGIGFNLLFWYFIVRRASNVAKWIWVVLTGIGVPYQIVILFFVHLVTLSPLQTAVNLVSLTGTVVCIVLLFRPDARQWFANRGQTIDAAVFS